MAHMYHDYWREFACCSDGSYVVAIGPTAVEADANAEKARVEKNAFLALEPLTVLKQIVAKDLNTMSHYDMQLAIRKIVEILDVP